MSDDSNFRRRVLSLPNTRNWCPPFQDDVFETLPGPEILSLANLSPNPLSAHHTCTQTQCKCDENPDLGLPQHTRDGCQCSLIGPPLEQVEQLIRRGAIPLVRLRKSPGQPLHVGVEEATFDSHYVAISHVWTGGLGNSETNQVYTCQLEEIAASGKQIRKCIQASRHPTVLDPIRRVHRAINDMGLSLFWMDTLCIPPKRYKPDRLGNPTRILTDESREVRRLALERMTPTYAYAHSVLVIDPVLRRTPVKRYTFINARVAVPSDHILRLIRMSDWSQRCWTYQEAAMAHRLFFKLSGGEVLDFTRERYRYVHDKFQPHEHVTRPNDLTSGRALTYWFSAMPAPRHNYENPTRRLIGKADPADFALVWNSLRTRRTSRKADRIVIFVLMMNLLPSRLLMLDVDGDNAVSTYMRVLFNSLETIPLDFIFEYGVSSDGFWLPCQGLHRKISLTSGLLRRESFEKNELILDRAGAMHVSSRAIVGETGAKPSGPPPALYVLPLQSISHSHFHFSILVGTNEQRIYLELGSSSDVRALHRYMTNADPQIAILLEDKRFEESDATVAVLFEVLQTNAPQDWTLKRIYAVSCKAVNMPSFPVPTLEEDLLADEHNKFRVLCDFNNAIRLPVHRERKSVEHPIWDLRSVFMEMYAYIIIFNLLYTGIMAAIVFTHNRASFSAGWFVLMFCYWSIQVVVQMLIRLSVQGESDRFAFMSWLDNMVPSTSDSRLPLFPRRAHLNIHVNYSPPETIFRLTVSLISVVIGIAYRSRRSVKWLTAWGMMIFMELAIRWATELAWVYWWKRVRPSTHELIQEVFRASWLTRQLLRIGLLKAPGGRLGGQRDDIESGSRRRETTSGSLASR